MAPFATKSGPKKSEGENISEGKICRAGEEGKSRNRSQLQRKYCACSAKHTSSEWKEKKSSLEGCYIHPQEEENSYGILINLILTPFAYYFHAIHPENGEKLTYHLSKEGDLGDCINIMIKHNIKY